MDAINRLPNEMQYEIISYLPISSILTARCVSSYWKTMISRNFVDFTCHISDESYPFVANATEMFSTVKIFDLSQKEKNVVSSTRGVGRIISNAQKLAFIGDNINASEVKKMLRYCVNIEELLFQRCTVPILMTTLGLSSSQHYYQNLSKLMFQFKELPTSEQTQFLKNLATLGNTSTSLSVLYHLGLQWTYKKGDPYLRFKASRAGEIFANYLATIRLITSVRRTLKSLEINRSPRVMLNMLFGLRHFTTHSYLQRAEIHKHLQNLGELKLNVLKLTLMAIEGKDPWLLEHALLQGQKSLSELTVIKKTCVNCQRSFLPQTLENLLPVNITNLTTVNVVMTIHGMAPINLSHFAQCKNLKYFRLSGHCYLFAPEDEWTCRVSELSCLPVSLQSLHFTPQLFNSSCEDNGLNGWDHLCSQFYRESYLMLTSRQIEWIVQNLVNLKSFGCLLIVEETDEEKMVNMGRVQVPAIEFNGDANMNLHLFKNLMGMRTVRCFELNMLRAGQLIRFGEEARRSLFSKGSGSCIRKEVGEYINCGRREMGFTVKTKVIPQRYIEMFIVK